MSEVAVICVLYKPTKDNLDNWSRLTEEFKDCIFIDNSSEEFLNTQKRSLSNYIDLGENKGIAYAQNVGIRKAKELGYKYVIFFDQDSIVNPKIILDLKQEYDDIKANDNKIAAIGPSLIEINTGVHYKGSNIESNIPQQVESIVSSGMLTEIDVLEAVGFMNEELFIDLVDQEWCWRALQKGYPVYGSGKTFMQHQVGRKKISFFGFPIIISAPIRYYYQYRNTIWLLKCPYAPKHWKKSVRIRRFIEILIVPFKTGSIFATYKHILRGIKDGFKYKSK